MADQDGAPTERLRRRTILGAGLAVVGASVFRRWGVVGSAQETEARFSYPIGFPGRVLGDGCFARDGFTVENTWYLPGYWHAGEDWYVLDGESAGTGVFAISDGDVVYMGGNYPGLVVIIQHDDELFSMYGHLDFAAEVEEGDRVGRGQRIGAVLERSDAVPNHLHFEVRTFVETAEVNGGTPRYGFGCGVDCPPGPGYWPIGAPDLPVDMGWRNPTHVISGRAFAGGAASGVPIVVSSIPSRDRAEVWSRPARSGDDRMLGYISLEPGRTLTARAVSVGAEAPAETSAEAYQVWYEIEVSDGEYGWVQGVIASDFEIGSDGRAASVRFDLLPEVRAG